MSRSLDDILAECLEAVAQGQRTVEDCLVLYPESAERLEPELRLALRLRQAYSDQEPQADFQAAARERFLSAVQARGAASRPARRLLPLPALLSRLRRPLPALPSWLRWRPAPAGWRPLAAAVTLSFIAGFLGFSSFVVASAGDTLPGDWRYPVKQLTERTRLTFTFGEDARREYRISLAEERLHEVRELAARDRPIGEAVLRRLVDTTEPLVEALGPSSVPPGQIERITDLTAQQQDVLGDVLVEEDAADELEQAMVVSSEGYEKAIDALAAALSQEPGGFPSLAPGTATPTGSPDASPTGESTPSSSPTPEASPTPTQAPGEATATPGEPTAEPTDEATVEPTVEPPPPTPTPTPGPQMVSLPDDQTGSITWSLLTIEDFSVRVPAPEEGAWVVSILASPERQIVFVGHRWANRFDAVVTIKVATGQASVSALVSGTLIGANLEDVPQLLPALDDIIFHIVDSATVAP